MNYLEIIQERDSRIYHFRNGAILYKTHDHSLVNKMVALGILAPEP